MRTNLKRISATAIAVAAAAVPAVALAHDGEGHHRNTNIRGTVASFTNNVLTITKANGKTVDGTVTAATRIRCKGAALRNHNEHGDDHGNDNDNDNEPEHHANVACDASKLVAGTVVRKAQLRAKPDNTKTWRSVELKVAS